MRQLPRILLLTGAAVIVIVALLVSGLRLVMPQINHHRGTLLNAVSSATGLTINAASLQGRWENFGSTLDVRQLAVALPDGDSLNIGRVTLALDVWQSLLHARWQFRELTFWQLDFDSHSPLISNDTTNHTLKAGQINDLFLRQFDHFDLRDSRIRFQTLSGQRAELSIPRLSWLNEKARHRAEGEVSLSSFTGQHGVVQVRLDLRDENGLLNSGRIWMQADDVDVKPWLGQWMRDNTTLQSARFSLAAWLSLKEGEVYDGDVWLKQGGARWQGDKQAHRLEVDNLTMHLARWHSGWTVTVPQNSLRTDGVAWPQGHFSLAWLPPHGIGPESQSAEELRVRATGLNLQRLEPLIPLFAQLSPQLLENWRTLQPQGQIDALALDIPLKQPDQSRFQARWRDLSWQHWQLLPGAQHVNGELSGSLADGRLDIGLHDAVMPYGTMFRAPLEVQRATGTLSWQHSEHALALQGTNLDVQARSLWAKGDFSYRQGDGLTPRLDILAGINVTNAGDAWRYFPEPLMGTGLTNYLSGAIKGGQVNNATLLFAGNPKLFPFRHNDGMFEVWVPLRNASYAFQPGWPAIDNLDIDLDFVNDGLWMKAQQAMLGKVQANNVSAVIPDYLKEKLIINGDLRGEAADIHDYFKQTPLKSSLGAALDELQLGGQTGGHLKLDIPLDGELVHARGDVQLADNTLFIAPLETRLTALNGSFTYDNGNLRSDTLHASWFGQPVNVDFHTTEGPQDYQIGVNLAADWQVNKLTPLPAGVSQQLNGTLPWQGNVAITLPHQGGANYKINLAGDLKNVSSNLPAPLAKARDEVLPLNVTATGDLNHFDLQGVVAKQQRFNSRWLLGKQLRLDRGIWLNNAKTTPALPDTRGITLNLPPLDGDSWLKLLMASGGTAGSAKKTGGNAFNKNALPGDITLSTPALQLAGQQWHDIQVTLRQLMAGGMQVETKGREISGQLDIPNSGPWRAHLGWLYYNPEWQSSGGALSSGSAQNSSTIKFAGWPALQIRCDDCWLRGQKFGRMQANLTPQNDTLALTDGLVDTGSSRLQINGEWVNRPGEQRTSLKGKLSGSNINNATNWFGVNTPLRDASFALDYDLHWRAAPWQPSASSLSGLLKTHFGKGQIADVSSGRAGQLLRLVSFDALLRKLRFDFSDTFSEGFWFDSINGTAWIKDGIMQTDNLLVDGLEADIAMQGKLDLVQRQIDMEAVVAPEISASVGVATAFAINPVVGAAVFAASKVLGPLWNKISLLRYHISGPLDKPEINEVLRKPREKSAK
ncbi:AsmA2 domain-containing protein YhdP [Mixta sp. Marseille-Q2659]|uniref:AsmA2 domain-containing protein YhdP n=1 Tax=Mixta sp. Marseille-Q2659 TaxID=2736607 RepID=UPI0023BA210F|nr:AsmA2 domain-containing protein YhdP [Mixta sp. Marseille-Q2659]